MRFLFITDTHIRSQAFRSRLDDMHETLERKFKEISNFAELNDIDAILHGGDLFDRPDVSILSVSFFAKILQDLPAPLYMIPGNHDIFAHNPKTLPRTMIGLLSELDVIKIIPKEGIIFENDIKVQLSAAPFRYDIDKGDRILYKQKRKDESIDWHILLTHGLLLDKAFFPDIPHTIIDELGPIDADIVLAGHYHNGFQTIEREKTLFINPGSLFRTSNSIIDMERKPKFVFIELNKNKPYIEIIPLKSAKTGDKVLSRDGIIENEMRQENIEHFKQLVREHVDLERYNISQIMEEISKENEIDQEIVKEAIKRLELAAFNE